MRSSPLSATSPLCFPPRPTPPLPLRPRPAKPSPHLPRRPTELLRVVRHSGGRRRRAPRHLVPVDPRRPGLATAVSSGDHRGQCVPHVSVSPGRVRSPGTRGRGDRPPLSMLQEGTGARDSGGGGGAPFPPRTAPHHRPPPAGGGRRGDDERRRQQDRRLGPPLGFTRDGQSFEHLLSVEPLPTPPASALHQVRRAPPSPVPPLPTLSPFPRRLPSRLLALSPPPPPPLLATSLVLRKPGEPRAGRPPWRLPPYDLHRPRPAAVASSAARSAGRRAPGTGTTWRPGPPTSGASGRLRRVELRAQQRHAAPVNSLPGQGAAVYHHPAMAALDAANPNGSPSPPSTPTCSSGSSPTATTTPSSPRRSSSTRTTCRTRRARSRSTACTARTATARPPSSA